MTRSKTTRSGAQKRRSAACRTQRTKSKTRSRTSACTNSPPTKPSPPGTTTRGCGRRQTLASRRTTCLRSSRKHCRTAEIQILAQVLVQGTSKRSLPPPRLRLHHFHPETLHRRW
ncbi:unnamed protein product [Amoebophrya sp. A120]|nr:unnamed protein product [Amoebophrya sp. A120]|eukprot:GSA120T00018525001.1